MRHIVRVLSAAGAAVCVCLLLGHAQDLSVDYRYSPSRHLNAICFPDDWQKTIVKEDGALAYDFGPGPYSHPLTTISVGVKGQKSKVLQQHFEDPRVPIAITLVAANDVVLDQQAFALVPQPSSSTLASPNTTLQSRVLRVGGLTGCTSWAKPDSTVDPLFRNVAWGTNRPVLYRVRVKPLSRHRVVLGVCESYKARPRSRTQELRVEGAQSLIVDPLRDSTKNIPYVFMFDGFDENGDGLLNVEAHAAPAGPDPNVILNAFWVFPEGTVINTDSLIAGRYTSKAEVAYGCGRELEEYASTVRVDGILSTMTKGSEQQAVRIRTARRLEYDAATHILNFEGHPYLITRPAAVAAVREKDGWTLEMPASARQVELIVVHGPLKAKTVTAIPDLTKELQRTEAYWKGLTILPRGTIKIPDAQIQYLFDASVRNIYQIRESVDGYQQLQPGPSVYRGMWIGDLLLSGVPTMMLGDTATERRFLESALRYQLPDGRIRVMVPYNTLSETPFTLLSMCLHARFAQDDRWLIAHWSALQKGFEWINRERDRTLAVPGALYRGLMPPSFVDGGLRDESADYGTVWWSLIALEKAIEAARRIGKNEDAARWSTLLEDFNTSYLPSVRRDLRTVGTRRYLAIGVGDTSTSALPQRGQYTFLMPVRYGAMFAANDSLTQDLIRSNLEMLDNVSVEGLIQGSGWMADGVWPWLGGVHGTAHNIAGDRYRAAELLYAYANHASPLGTWMEEQQPKHLGNGTAGDGSNAEASAVFVHLVRDILVVERGGTLEIFRGVPEFWLHANSTIELRDILTEYGPVLIRLEIGKHSAKANLEIVLPKRAKGVAPALVHLGGLKRRGFIFRDGMGLPETMEVGWGEKRAWEFVRPE